MTRRDALPVQRVVIKILLPNWRRPTRAGRNCLPSLLAGEAVFQTRYTTIQTHSDLSIVTSFLMTNGLTTLHTCQTAADIFIIFNKALELVFSNHFCRKTTPSQVTPGWA